MGLLRFTLCKTEKNVNQLKPLNVLVNRLCQYSEANRGRETQTPPVSPSARVLCSHEFYITVYVETAQRRQTQAQWRKEHGQRAGKCSGCRPQHSARRRAHPDGKPLEHEPARAAHSHNTL